MEKGPQRFPFTEYLDFRRLLDDYIQYLKDNRHAKFSYRAFSSKAGFKSSNYINLIIDNKRGLSMEASYGLARAMGMNQRETDFFINLVAFNMAKTGDEKNFYFKKLRTYKEFKKKYKLELTQFEFFSHWYTVIIKEMINLTGFKPDPEWIASKLLIPISADSARHALELLVKLGLVKQDQQRWVVAHPHIETDHEVASAYLANFHREMILIAKECLKQPAKHRSLAALSMTISEEEFNVIKNKAEQFIDEVQNYLASCQDIKTDRVCQLNLQFFHLVTNILR